MLGAAGFHTAGFQRCQTPPAASQQTPVCDRYGRGHVARTLVYITCCSAPSSKMHSSDHGKGTHEGMRLARRVRTRRDQATGCASARLPPRVLSGSLSEGHRVKQRSPAASSRIRSTCTSSSTSTSDCPAHQACHAMICTPFWDDPHMHQLMSCHPVGRV